jgi:predicted esterase
VKRCIHWAWTAALLLVAVASPAQDPRPSKDEPAGKKAFQLALEDATLAYQEEAWDEAQTLYEKAGEAGVALLAQHPRDSHLRLMAPISFYNGACSAALAGRVEDAFELLRRAVTAGYIDRAQMEADPDLATLRDHKARWEAIMTDADRQIAATLAEHPEVAVHLPEGLLPASPGLVVLAAGGSGTRDAVRVWTPVAEELDRGLVVIRGSRLAVPGMFLWQIRDWEIERDRVERLLGETLRETPALDPGRLTLAGYSQGGGMAMILASQSTRQWDGVFVIGAAYPPSLHAPLGSEFPRAGGAIYAVIGEHEDPPTLHVHRELFAPGQPGAERHLEILEGRGHPLPEDFTARAVAGIRWLEEHAGEP